MKAIEHLGSVLSHAGAFVPPRTVSGARVAEVFDEGGHGRDEALGTWIRGLATAPLPHPRR